MTIAAFPRNDTIAPLLNVAKKVAAYMATRRTKCSPAWARIRCTFYVLSALTCAAAAVTMLAIAAVAPLIKRAWCALEYQEYSFPMQSLLLVLGAIALLIAIVPLLRNAARDRKMFDQDFDANEDTTQEIPRVR